MITPKQLERTPAHTLFIWERGSEIDHGKLIRLKDASFIEWTDGQRTYTSDDAALLFVSFYPKGEK